MQLATQEVRAFVLVTTYYKEPDTTLPTVDTATAYVNATSPTGRTLHLTTNGFSFMSHLLAAVASPPLQLASVCQMAHSLVLPTNLLIRSISANGKSIYSRILCI